MNHGPAPRSAGAVDCITFKTSLDQRNRESLDQRRESTYDYGAPLWRGGGGDPEVLNVRRRSADSTITPLSFGHCSAFNDR